MASEVEFESVEEGRGVVGRHGVHEVQIVDGVSEAVQVSLEARPPIVPHPFVHTGG